MELVAWISILSFVTNFALAMAAIRHAQGIRSTTAPALPMVTSGTRMTGRTPQKIVVRQQPG